MTPPDTPRAIRPHWLNPERLRVYPRMVLAIILVTAIAWMAMSKHLVDPRGKPIGYDFITFWAASHLALTHHAADAYNIPLIFQSEKLAVPASKGVFVWYYPPTFYLLILPLALLPYLLSYWVFTLTTLAAYLAAFRHVVRSSFPSQALWCLAGFSGLWLNLFHGQNAFLTAALAAAALLSFDTQPILAGVFLGLLAIKPHLALLFPVALIAIGAWRTLVTALLTGATFLALGTAILGLDTLHACLGSLRYARLFLEGGFLPWVKMPTVFALLRLLHVPVTAAYLVHGIVALLATIVVWRIWRTSHDRQLQAASLMTATFLISPYVFDYDLAWLAFPIAWLALIGLRDGWRPGEREALVAAWVLPVAMSPIVKLTHLQSAPFVLGWLLWLMLRRASSQTLQKKWVPENGATFKHSAFLSTK